ncbi:GIN domain-containing protein [Sphingomicrobium lutaoense]|uniref:Putative auto-transporter adhesin head GIN domain-containing protein n=1 Tax=Sphingomicrobium lutaoense TaxID=515949 RepID=A0A839Z1U1_9SPHN|nr:DUF2807 domain-containing protein [Sphingomicrobium lutaoense]MBB3764620.1 hypothetical protein [Sphingomicrobium lutaoense]
MKIIALLLSLCALAAPASAQQRNYTVTSFTQLRVDGAIHVKLTTDSAPFARASGKAAATNAVDIRMNGRTLTISLRRDAWGAYPGDDGGPLLVEVGTHRIERASLSGSGRLDIDRLEGMKAGLALRGAGSLQVGAIELDEFTLLVAGAGSARIAGSAKQASIKVQGLSALDAANFMADELSMAVEGPALVRIGADDSLDLSVAGAADIVVSGNPACTMTVRGAASISGCRR